jgi:hypothetical protein
MVGAWSETCTDRLRSEDPYSYRWCSSARPFGERDHIQVVEAWDSREAYERFPESRLVPTMQRMAAEHGMGHASGASA